MLLKIMADIDTRQARRDGNRDLRAGMKGLAKGFDPHMLHLTSLVKKVGMQ